MVRIEITRSSGRESNKSGPAAEDEEEEAISGEILIRFRLTVRSPAEKSFLLLNTFVSEHMELPPTTTLG